MSVSRSGYYYGHKCPASVISFETLKKYRLVRQLLKQSCDSLGNREMVKKLRKEGYQVGRYLVRKIMHGLRLKATQRRDYKMMT